MLDRRRRTTGALLLSLGLTGSLAVSVGDAEETLRTVVFVLRHAEKEAGQADPSLTPRGETRAHRVASMLASSGVTHVWSSDYRRTLETAAPIARAAGCEIGVYDPHRLEDLVDRIRSEPGVHVVVGHSNTSPEVVRLLGGDPGPPIDDASEFDRLYVVALAGEHEPTVVRLSSDLPAP